jgi:hypothetical protein
MELEVNRLLTRTAAASRAEGTSWQRISELSGKAGKGAWLRWHNADTAPERPTRTQPSREIGLD